MVALAQAQIANTEAKKATWSNNFLLGIFEKADPIKNQQQPITVNDLIQKATTNLLENKNDLTPETKLNAFELLSDIHMKLGHVESVIDINLERLKVLKINKADSDELANAHHETALVYGKLANFNQALNHWESAKPRASRSEY